MIQNRRTRDEGVSPVVGVMLMLVVTIIIAAMVAAFSGTLTQDQKVAPSITLATSYTASITDTDKTNSEPNHAATFKPNNGVMFRMSGGDSFSLRDITVQLKNGDRVLNVNMDTHINTSKAAVDNVKLKLIEDSPGVYTYFGRPGGGDDLITVGDSFMIVADDCYDSTLVTDQTVTKGRFLTWSPDGSSGTFEVQVNVPFEYTVIDRLSGKPMQSGTIVIR